MKIQCSAIYKKLKEFKLILLQARNGYRMKAYIFSSLYYHFLKNMLRVPLRD